MVARASVPSNNVPRAPENSTASGPFRSLDVHLFSPVGIDTPCDINRAIRLTALPELVLSSGLPPELKVLPVEEEAGVGCMRLAFCLGCVSRGSYTAVCGLEVCCNSSFVYSGRSCRRDTQ